MSIFDLFKKNSNYEYHNNYKIVGVTFDNDDGTSRQDIIKTLKDKDKLLLKSYIYENKNAIGVYTTDSKQIGNIRDKDVPYVLDRLRTMVDCEIFNVRSFYSYELEKVIWTAEVIITYK